MLVALGVAGRVHVREKVPDVPDTAADDRRLVDRETVPGDGLGLGDPPRGLAVERQFGGRGEVLV